MIIDLNSFDREKAIDETFAATAIALELANAKVIEQVMVSGTAIKSSSSVGIKGRLTTALEIDCDRCLDLVKHAIDIELDLEFAPKQQLEGDASLELHGDDMKLDAIDGSELDLAVIVREQIVLDLPQQFFCSDDCKGLCEKCGTNLNLKDCECEYNEIDPRWGALKNLN